MNYKITSVILLCLLWNILYCQGDTSRHEGRFFYNIALDAKFGVGKISDTDDIPVRNDESVLAASIIGGLKLKSIDLGLGVGIEKWENSYLFPIFTRLNIPLLKTTSGSHILFDFGYLIGERDENIFKDSEQGYFFFEPGIGYCFKVKELLFDFALQYHHQIMKSSSLRVRNPASPYYEKYQVYYHFIQLSVGIRL